MFSVIFEAFPNKENWDDYLDNAEMLRPALEQIEGFVDNIRYKSLIREGWILSLSNWRTRVARPLAHPQAPSRGPAEGPRRNPRRLPPARRPDHCRQSGADGVGPHGAEA